jgi:hypothetical protein
MAFDSITSKQEPARRFSRAVYKGTMHQDDVFNPWRSCGLPAGIADQGMGAF